MQSILDDRNYDYSPEYFYIACEGTVSMWLYQDATDASYSFHFKEPKKIKITSLNNMAYSLDIHTKSNLVFSRDCYLEIDDPDNVTQYDVNVHDYLKYVDQSVDISDARRIVIKYDLSSRAAETLADLDKDTLMST